MSSFAVILLVEDNHMDVELTLDAFREINLRNPVHVVKSGEAALDYVHGRGDYTDRNNYPLPDLILLDLNLPGISGIDVLRELKSTQIIRRVPVIVLTSSKEESDRAATYDLGVNSFLVKPVQHGGFLTVVQEISDYWLSLNVGPPPE